MHPSIAVVGVRPCSSTTPAEQAYLELDGLGELSFLADNLRVALLNGLPGRVGEDIIHSLGYEFAIQLAAHLCQMLLVRARTEKRPLLHPPHPHTKKHHHAEANM